MICTIISQWTASTLPAEGRDPELKDETQRREEAEGRDPELKDETQRCEEGEAEMRKKIKEGRDHHKKWEETREERVGGWRDFVGTKTKGKKSVNELKAPKLKTNDEDKTYIQRPVGEQFRPPPPKSAGAKGGLAKEATGLPKRH
eukprot:gene5648-8973_t